MEWSAGDGDGDESVVRRISFEEGEAQAGTDGASELRMTRGDVKYLMEAATRGLGGTAAVRVLGEARVPSGSGRALSCRFVSAGVMTE